jgi:hypothetical protein
MPPGQRSLDPLLLLPEPVQRTVDLALLDTAELERHAQARARRLGREGAHRGQLGARGDDPVDDHRQRQSAPTRGGLAATPEQQTRQVELACHAQHGGNVAVRQRAQQGQLAHRRLRHGSAAPQEHAQALDQLGRPVGEVGQGALLGSAGLAVALAQQHGRRRIPVRHRLDVHGRDGS